MIVQRQALELLQGQPSEYAVEHGDGRRWQWRFCGACATRLWSEPRRFPQLATLRPGTFDDTRWLRPVGHIWTRSAQPWVPIPADALRYEQQPDDFMPMITAWRARRSSPQGES
jgi:hypothetical protein